MNLALVAAALLSAPLVVVAPVECLPALTAVLWVWCARGFSRLALAFAVTVLVAGMARAHVFADAGKRDRYELQFHEPSECEADVVVLGRSRGHLDVDAARFSSRVETSLLRCSNRDGDPVTHAFPRSLPMMLTSDVPLHRGDHAAILATVALVYPWDNPGALDRDFADAARRYAVTANARTVDVTARSRSILAAIDRVRDAVRAHIWKAYPADVESLVRALVIGEADLQPDVTTDLRGSGLLHLLAVSGMHLVVVLGALRRVLSAVLVRIEALAARVDVERLAHAVTGMLAFLYADFAGGSGSAWRAAWMSAVVLVVRAFERRPCPRRALSGSVIMMALLDPLAVFDVSLLLSALATSGLVLSESNGKHSYLLSSLRATGAATLPCAPVLAKMAGSLSLGAFAANLVAVPIGEAIALPACLIEPLAGGVPWLQKRVVDLGAGGLRVVMMVAHSVNDIDFLKVGVPPPSPTQNSFLVAGVVLRLGFPRRSKHVVIAACTAVLLVELRLRLEAAKEGELAMIALDVGQGDATLVHFPDGQWGLIDAGGLIGPGVDVGARVIAPVLRELRISELALVVLSHPHPDHFGGFRSGLAGVPVREFWDTGQGEREAVAGEYATWLSLMRQAGVPIARPETLCGEAPFHGATVAVLMPCPSSDSTRTPNDNSFMIKLSYKKRSFLLVGDAEREEEAIAFATYARDLRADVLKVGHHGSRTSTSDSFLRAVEPAIACISSGVRNRFGHPHPLTLETLARREVQVTRTDHSGAITIVTDGASLTLSARR